MADENGRLGASIRRARKRRGLTMRQVAEASGLSISFISQLERDLVSPSVNSLQKVSRALGMQIGGFFEDQGKTGRVIRAHERPRLIFPIGPKKNTCSRRLIRSGSRCCTTGFNPA